MAGLNSEIAVTSDPAQFLIERFRIYFKTSIPHEYYCIEPPAEPGAPHVCDPGAHLHFLLASIWDDGERYIPTEGPCLGVVSTQNGASIYVHINPRGSLIYGVKGSEFRNELGQGGSDHPLTRVLFWHTLLERRPDFVPLFEQSYRSILNADLMRRHWIQEYWDTPGAMITDLCLRSCLECDQPIMTHVSHLNSFEAPGRFYGHCGRAHLHDYHFILIGVLQNGWTPRAGGPDQNESRIGGRSFIRYMEEVLPIVQSHSSLTLGTIEFTGMIRRSFDRYLKFHHHHIIQHPPQLESETVDDY